MAYLHLTAPKVKRQSKKSKWSNFNYARNLFEGSAKDYDVYMAALLSELVEKKYVIAEYGCGDGIWLEYLGGKYPDKKFIGLEWNERLVEYAKEHRVKNLENVTIHQADISQHCVDCDFLFALGVMEHFDNAVDVVKTWVDHLDSNGFALITVPNLLHTVYVHFRHNLPFQQVLGKDAIPVEAYGFEWLWSHNTFLRNVMDAGLEILFYRIIEESNERGQLVVAFKRSDKTSLVRRSG